LREQERVQVEEQAKEAVEKVVRDRRKIEEDRAEGRGELRRVGRR
jgi:hypothetical protein